MLQLYESRPECVNAPDESTDFTTVVRHDRLFRARCRDSACRLPAVSWLVFDARPLFIDEIVQVYQARVFAARTLTDHVGPFPEFFGALNVVSVGDTQFGQFPPGGPAHLFLGVLVGAPWLITPLLGSAAVYTFAMFVRRIEPEAPIALASTLLLAFSPFMIFMSAWYMNHVPRCFGCSLRGLHALA